LAWGSSYYLPAILADPIAHDLGISSNWFFAAFSASLVISGLLGPRVGRHIDRVGGRQVLCVSNLVLAAGLALLGASASVWTMSAAWLLLGIGMGLGLYDAAYLPASLTRSAPSYFTSWSQSGRSGTWAAVVGRQNSKVLGIGGT
jgi:MFS family permease